MANYAGLEIFQPPNQDAEVAQHALDVAQAAAAVALCEKIKATSQARSTLLAQVAGWLQVQRPGPEGPANSLNALETASVAETHVQSDVFNYEGAVKGWVAYIQTLRSINARVPGMIAPERLVMPAMPQELVDYAKANGLS